MSLKKVIATVLYACILVAIIVIINGLISDSTELSLTAIILGFHLGVVHIYIFFQEKTLII